MPNDILLANASDKEHLETLRNVVAKLQESGLKLKQIYADISGILGTLHQGGYTSNTNIVRSTSTSKCPVEIILG